LPLVKVECCTLSPSNDTVEFVPALFFVLALLNVICSKKVDRDGLIFEFLVNSGNSSDHL